MKNEQIGRFKIVNRGNLARVRAREAVNASRLKAKPVKHSNLPKPSKLPTIFAVIFLFLFILASIVIFVPDVRDNFLNTIEGIRQGNTHQTNENTKSDDQNTTSGNQQSDTSNNSSNNSSKNDENKENNTNNDNKTDSSKSSANKSITDQIREAILDYFNASSYSEIPSANAGELLSSIWSISESSKGKAIIRIDVTYTNTSRAAVRKAANTVAEICRDKIPDLQSITFVTSDNYYIETAKVN